MKKPIRITIISAVSAVIIAAASFAASSVYRNSTGYHISLAERYLSEMNYEQAIIEFEKLIEIEPRNADLWLGLADAYSMTGRPDKAREVLQRALESVSDNRINAKLAGIEPDENSKPITAPPESTTTTTVAREIIVSEASANEENAPNESTDDIDLTVPGIIIYDGEELQFNFDLEFTRPTTTALPVEEEVGIKEYTADDVAKMIKNYILYGDELDEAPLRRVNRLTIIGPEYIWVDYGVETGKSDPDIAGYWTTSPGGVIKTTYRCYDGSEREFGNGNITDISFIDLMPSLISLEICYNNITDISPLLGRNEIGSLDLRGNNIRDISALKGLAGIETLYLSNNNIDFSIFAETASEMPALERVYLDHNGITDINDIYKLKNSSVYELSLSNNKISDISPIRHLTDLRRLCIDGNDLSDISALESLTNLEYLQISYVSDMSVLKKLKNLKWLWIDVNGDNNIPTHSLEEELRSALPNCDVHVSLTQD